MHFLQTRNAILLAFQRQQTPQIIPTTTSNPTCIIIIATINYPVLIRKIVFQKQLQPTELTHCFHKINRRNMDGVKVKSKIKSISFKKLFVVKKILLVFIEEIKLYVAKYNVANKTNIVLQPNDFIKLLMNFRDIVDDIGHYFLRSRNPPNWGE